MFLFYQILDEALDIRCLPFEVTFWSVCRAYVRFEEENAGISKRPVIRNGELCARFDMFNDAFEIVVLTDEFESGGRTNAFYRVEVIATEEDTEVDELKQSLLKHYLI